MNKMPVTHHSTSGQRNRCYTLLRQRQKSLMYMQGDALYLVIFCFKPGTEKIRHHNPSWLLEYRLFLWQIYRGSWGVNRNMVYKEVFMFTLDKAWICGQNFLPGLLSFPFINEQLVQTQENGVAFRGHFRSLKGDAIIYLFFEKRKIVNTKSDRPGGQNGSRNSGLFTNISTYSSFPISENSL